MSETTRIPRSVDDYDTDEALAHAIQWMEISFDGNVELKTEKTTTERAQAEEPKLGERLPENSDWVLTNYDPNTTKAPSVQEEYERLRVLRSYMILDVEPEVVFEKFTAQATREFCVPIALVSLVDLGRQWFLSNNGIIADVPETSRDVAFCAHAILRKDQYSVLEVRDATKDFRFRENPLVTGPPRIRFYAGAPLVAPEGHSLGTFCIIDTKARPEGLTNKQKDTLKDLAAQTVQRMVDRRRKLEGRGITPRTRRAGRQVRSTVQELPVQACY
jgi:GAF domain-containing protein